MVVVDVRGTVSIHTEECLTDTVKNINAFVICWIGLCNHVCLTHLTLTLVQMMYSISSENGFWKVKELVRIQINSLDLVRNRNITDRT